MKLTESEIILVINTLKYIGEIDELAPDEIQLLGKLENRNKTTMEKLEEEGK